MVVTTRHSKALRLWGASLKTVGHQLSNGAQITIPGAQIMSTVAGLQSEDEDEEEEEEEPGLAGITWTKLSRGVPRSGARDRQRDAALLQRGKSHHCEGVSPNTAAA